MLRDALAALADLPLGWEVPTSMDTVMPPAHDTQPPARRAPRPVHALTRAVLPLALVLASAGPACTQALAASAGVTTTTTPATAAPASANPQSATRGATAAPAGGSTAPTTTTTPPAATTPASVPPATSTQTTTSPAGAATGTTQPTGTAQPTGSAAVVVHTQTHSTSKLSNTAIVAAVLAALIALACLAWGLARMRAFEPHWMLSLRHVDGRGGLPRLRHVGRIHRLGPPRALARARPPRGCFYAAVWGLKDHASEPPSAIL